MKKNLVIIIEILLLLTSAVFLYFNISYWNGVKSNIEHNILARDDLKDVFYSTLTSAILLLFGLLATFTSMVLLAIKDFKCFQPFVERQKEKYNQRKQERIAAREQKAETDKQKRIEELQAELDELKKPADSAEPKE